MLTKIRHIICHPAFLGLYMKNKAIQVVGYWFGFLLFTIILLAGVDMHTEFLDSNFAGDLATLILDEDSVQDTVFVSNRLTGTKKTISKGSVMVFFNENSYSASSTTTINFIFMDEMAYMYAQNQQIGSIRYSDYSFSDFSFQEIKQGNIEQSWIFETLVGELVKSGEKEYRGIYFFNDLAVLLLTYLLCFICTYFVSFMVNPPIERRIRVKLVVFDTLIFFVATWISICYQVEWISYLAMGLPLVFAVRTFSHIRKITVKRRENNDN